ncbi:MAG: rod shape-determining protein MreC [Gammaproteobacteria bacterium]|nr:rod shape-determining protein MreC [Gammaproteobacteria bacterium]
MKPLFTQTASPTVRLLACMVLSFILISVDRTQGALGQVRSALSVMIYPVQYVVNLPVRAAGAVVTGLVARKSLVSDNERLYRENLMLQTRAQRFNALQEENRRLRLLLDSTPSGGDRVLIADLMAVSTRNSAHEVVLNKGQRNGVFVGQPVLDASGIMGQILHAGPFSSTGMLITDPRQAVPVMLNRTGLRAIAVGTESGLWLDVDFIPNNADVREGDLLVSSGMGGVFPAGYPVAEIISVRLDPADAFAIVRAQPSADLARARQVILVWPEETALATQAGDAEEIPP